MEQPSTPPVKQPSAPESATVYRAAPRRSAPVVLGAIRLLRRIERVPGPRLTGLGCGLACLLLMFAAGLLDDLLLGASPTAYGLMFVIVSCAAGLWVRPSELITAPISAPIAFTVGLQPVSGAEGGVGSQVVAVFTQLALHAGWLYGGTLAACLTVALRKVLSLGDRASAGSNRPAPSRTARKAGRA